MTSPEPGPDIVEWMVLRRVHDGGVSTRDGAYVQHGHPIGGEVADALARLVKDGCLALGRPDSGGHHTVCVTAVGQARYVGLREAFGG